jgi:hypothetical protein
MDDIQELKKTVKEQEKQILALKKVADTMMRRLKETDKRARRNSEELRRSTNEISIIKRAMEVVKRKLRIY